MDIVKAVDRSLSLSTTNIESSKSIPQGDEEENQQGSKTRDSDIFISLPNPQQDIINLPFSYPRLRSRPRRRDAWVHPIGTITIAPRTNRPILASTNAWLDNSLGQPLPFKQRFPFPPHLHLRSVTRFLSPLLPTQEPWPNAINPKTHHSRQSYMRTSLERE